MRESRFAEQHGSGTELLFSDIENSFVIRQRRVSDVHNANIFAIIPSHIVLS